MPTPPRSRRLRLETLEDRRLLSAGDGPPDPIVVTGTNANDVITLTRLQDGRVEVTIQSFRDPEWTQPTGKPVVRYEVQAGCGYLDFSGLCTVDTTTGTIRVEAGAGTDRIDVVDALGFTPYVGGTNRTAPPPPDDGLWIDGTPVDESGGRWAIGDRSATEVALVDGVDMPDGAAVGVRFHAGLETLPAIVDPVTDEPGPADPLPIATGMGAVAVEGVDMQLEAAGFHMLIGFADEGWPAIDAEGGPYARTDNPISADDAFPWAEEFPDDQSDPSSTSLAIAVGGQVGDSMDDWLVTDLEA